MRGHPVFTVQWVLKGREKEPVEVEEFVVNGREVLLAIVASDYPPLAG
jgi:hypothetical protein